MAALPETRWTGKLYSCLGILFLKLKTVERGISFEGKKIHFEKAEILYFGELAI